jgi:hypothetical protein
MGRRLNWTQWNPGLHHGERTLGEVKSTLPAAPPNAIPWIVRLMENPASKWASPGAITLDRHDNVHILLGRGLKSEDEAFVIGFTNGAATNIENRQTAALRALTYLRMPFAGFKERNRKLRDWQYALYMFVAKYVYRPPYRFSDTDLAAFKMGFAYGESMPVHDLQDVPFETMQDIAVSEVRKKLGIDVWHLESIYAFENSMLHTPVSRRLDTDAEIDHSDITVPEGIESDWVLEKKAAAER